MAAVTLREQRVREHIARVASLEQIANVVRELIGLAEGHYLLSQLAAIRQEFGPAVQSSFRSIVIANTRPFEPMIYEISDLRNNKKIYVIAKSDSRFMYNSNVATLERREETVAGHQEMATVAARESESILSQRVQKIIRTADLFAIDRFTSPEVDARMETQYQSTKVEDRFALWDVCAELDAYPTNNTLDYMAYLWLQCRHGMEGARVYTLRDVNWEIAREVAAPVLQKVHQGITSQEQLALKQVQKACENPDPDPVLQKAVQTVRGKADPFKADPLLHEVIYDIADQHSTTIFSLESEANYLKQLQAVLFRTEINDLCTRNAVGVAGGREGEFAERYLSRLSRFDPMQMADRNPMMVRSILHFATLPHVNEIVVFVDIRHLLGEAGIITQLRREDFLSVTLMGPDDEAQSM